ncbi:MAG: CoB--CoM heterodisulfide reductase iron-sulfur subunit B family protein [Chloroflexi bacterium]|nr:CoB--CoM heterodisulfide reductase iron-sulfur subunit B family protein [Chloroflexota bacterium]
MKMPYYPGCTLNTKAKGFDNSARASARELGLELVELEEWNCCGATFPLLVDNMLDLAGPARVLISARQAGQRLAVACSTCYNVLKRTNKVIRENEDSREKLNFFLEADYSGDLEVLDLLQVLRDDIGFDKVKEAVKKPLLGLKVAAYYGCMVLRPPAEVAYDDPENPRALDDLITALGAEAVGYSHQGECCGAYLAVKSAEVTAEMGFTILASAQRSGAELVATNCPLCQFNLDRMQKAMGSRHTGFQPIPILYFTQLMGIALGLDSDGFELDRHYVDPRPVLTKWSGGS